MAFLTWIVTSAICNDLHCASLPPYINSCLNRTFFGCVTTDSTSSPVSCHEAGTEGLWGQWKRSADPYPVATHSVRQGFGFFCPALSDDPTPAVCRIVHQLQRLFLSHKSWFEVIYPVWTMKKKCKFIVLYFHVIKRRWWYGAIYI